MLKRTQTKLAMLPQFTVGLNSVRVLNNSVAYDFYGYWYSQGLA